MADPYAILDEAPTSTLLPKTRAQMGTRPTPSAPAPPVAPAPLPTPETMQAGLAVRESTPPAPAVPPYQGWDPLKRGLAQLPPAAQQTYGWLPLPHSTPELAEWAALYGLTSSPIAAKVGVEATEAALPAISKAVDWMRHPGILRGLTRAAATGAVGGGTEAIGAAGGAELGYGPGLRRGDIEREAAKGAAAGVIQMPLEYTAGKLAQLYGSRRALEAATPQVAKVFRRAIPGLWEKGATDQQVIADVIKGDRVLGLQQDLNAAMAKTPVANLWQQAEKDPKAQRAVVEALARVDPEAAAGIRTTIEQIKRVKAWQTWITGAYGPGQKGFEKGVEALKQMTDPQTKNLTAEGVARIGLILSRPPPGLDVSDLPFWQEGMGAARAVAGEYPEFRFPLGIPTLHRPGTVPYVPGWESQVSPWVRIPTNLAPSVVSTGTTGVTLPRVWPASWGQETR
jgi:hypothetical protein